MTGNKRKHSMVTIVGMSAAVSSLRGLIPSFPKARLRIEKPAGFGALANPVEIPSEFKSVSGLITLIVFTI